MTLGNLVRPIMAGVLHSFEPDHVTAVSVLATEKAVNNEKTSVRTLFQASQWALGHSVTLLLFGGIALLFKSTAEQFVTGLSFWAEVAVGPIMIFLGIVAIRRNYRLNEILKDHKKIEEHDHVNSNLIHLHGKSGEEIAMNPIKRSFWIGMVHGLAGTGGALTSVLVLSSRTTGDALIILGVESIGIIIAMGVYSYSLIFMLSRFIEKNMLIFKWMNAGAGLASIMIGIYMFINQCFL